MIVPSSSCLCNERLGWYVGQGPVVGCNSVGVVRGLFEGCFGAWVMVDGV